jgi:hypothetical protein
MYLQLQNFKISVFCSVLQPFYASHIIITIESKLLFKPHHFVLCMIYLSATRCVSVPRTYTLTPSSLTLCVCVATKLNSSDHPVVSCNWLRRHHGHWITDTEMWTWGQEALLYVHDWLNVRNLHFMSYPLAASDSCLFSSCAACLVTA